MTCHCYKAKINQSLMARSLETIIMDTLGHDPIATFNFGNFKV